MGLSRTCAIHCAVGSSSGSPATKRWRRHERSYCVRNFGECDGVTAGVALHALGAAGGAGGVEDIRRMAGVDPFAGDLRVHVAGAERGIIDIAAGDILGVGVEAAVDDEDVGGRKLREVEG